MDRKVLKALIDAGAVRKVRVIGEGSYFRLEVETRQGPQAVNTVAGSLKTWNTIDAAAKWIHDLGIGTLQLEISRWQPGQRGLRI